MPVFSSRPCPVSRTELSSVRLQRPGIRAKKSRPHSRAKTIDSTART